VSIVVDRPLAPMSSPIPVTEVPDAGPPRTLLTRLCRSLATENWIVAIVALAAYLTVAILLDFKYVILPGDAVARMANGYYVLWSRDPHLAAVGFVWSPLQSFADIPFLLFKPLFPVLATHDLAGSLASVLSGVGAVYQIHAALREWGVRRGPRLMLTLVFGINPMIIYYAGNGMSDMLLIFLLVMTTRYFLRWLYREDLRSLVYAGSALGLAYLDRYEALGAAGMAGVVVLGVSYWRRAGRASVARFKSAFGDLTIFLIPIATTFIAWAMMSYVIVGQAFPGVSSQYGTASQTSAAAYLTLADRANHLIHNVGYLAPLLPIGLVLAIFFSARRRDIRILAPLAILGGSITFDALGLMANFLEPWYRYFMVCVPLDVMLVGCILAHGTTSIRTPESAVAHTANTSVKDQRKRNFAANAFGIAAVVILLGVSVPTSGKGIFANGTQSSESTELGALLLAHPSKIQLLFTRHFAHIQSIDAYIGDMHLPDGSIVAGTFADCTPQIVTSVPNSKIFVITNDRDFQQVVADPLTFGAHYLLVPQNIGVGLVDPLNERYPTLYANGAGFAKLVHQFNSNDGTCAVYRLYRVTGHNGQTA
jgi:hypothetical protein